MSTKLVLFAVDDPDQCKQWKRRLRRAHYEVLTVGNFEDALSGVQEDYFHLAVIDIDLRDNMGMSRGLELAARVQASVHPVPWIAIGDPEYEVVRRVYEDLKAYGFFPRGALDAADEVMKKIDEAFDKEIQCNFQLRISPVPEEDVLDRMIDGLELGQVDLTNWKIRAKLRQEIKDLLGKLFRRDYQIDIIPLIPGYSGAGVRLVLPYRIIDDVLRRCPSVVVKYGEISKILSESKNYDKYVSSLIPSAHRPEMIKVKTTSHLGGVLYHFAGIPLEEANDLHRAYLSRKGSIDQQVHRVYLILEDLFLKTFEHWRESRPPKTRLNVREEYLERLISPAKLQAGFEETFPKWKSQRLLELDELGGLKLKTFVYELMGQEFKEVMGYVTITHGDLNGRNILLHEHLTERGDVAYVTTVIDFYHTGMGHILRDFIKLESYIKLESLKTEDWEALNAFEEALNSPTQLSLDDLGPIQRYDDLVKAYHVIWKLRALAASWTGEPWEWIRDEYYIGLFYQTLAMLQYGIGDARKKLALLSANKIHDLLSHKLAD